jgi:hypothetical protein
LFSYDEHSERLSQATRFSFRGGNVHWETRVLLGFFKYWKFGGLGFHFSCYFLAKRKSQ